MHIDSSISVTARYFNLHNSHWEPVVESCALSLNYHLLPDSKSPSVNLFSSQKLEMVLSYSFLAYCNGVLPRLQKTDLASFNFLTKYLIDVARFAYEKWRTRAIYH